MKLLPAALKSFSPKSRRPRGLGASTERRHVAGLALSNRVSRQHAGAPCSRTAFSLLEVMIACGIFFMCIFAILAMVSSVVRNARALRRVDVDCGMVASQIYKTNKLYEGTESGDFGNIAPDYNWETQITEAATNGLFQVDIVVRRRGGDKPVDAMSIWVYAPDSPPAGGFGRPTFR